MQKEEKVHSGIKAKQHTIDVLYTNPCVIDIRKGLDLSKNRIEKAICDLEITLVNHTQVLVCITSTNSFRDDRLDIANTRMFRHKKANQESFQPCIYIVTSNCDNERTSGDDIELLHAYNFENRDMIGIDLLVKTKDINNLLIAINNTEECNNPIAMILAGLAYLESIGYKKKQENN